MAKSDYSDRSDDAPKESGAHKVTRLYNDGLRAVRSEYLNYWTNHAFLLGEQWLYLDSSRNTIDTLPRDPDRVQVVVNKLWPNSRTILSKLVSRPLAFNVPPRRADDASIRAAHLGESILRDTARAQDWEGVREDLGWATWKGGTGALCLDWDPEAGTELATTERGRKVGTGEARTTALSMPDFVVQPGVRDAERARWWIKAIALPPTDAQEQYGLAKAPKPDASAALTPFAAKMLADHNRLGSDAQVDLTRVLTYYERPNRLTPPGKVCVVIGDEVVDEGPWPFPFKDVLNLTIMRETRVGGRWTGETVLKIARPVQTAINQSWSSIIEHMKLAGNARLWVPQSVVDLIDSLTDEPGEIVPYPDGTEHPDWSSPPQMPAWWIEQPIALKNELDDIMGVHDVSRGVAPTNSPESGLGISILVEQDSTPIGRLSKESSITWSRHATKVLQTYEAKVKETRTAVITHARGQAPETAEWRGADLMGQTDAEVPLDAIMPRSQAQSMELAKTAVEMGLIAPGPGALEQFVKVAELGGMEDILDALSPDVAKARRENYQLATGAVVIPAKFDDHTAHNPEHLNFMKSSTWDTIPPEAQQNFLLHLQGHATMSAEQLGLAGAKAQTSPLLALAAQTDSTPVLPVEALAGAGATAPPMGPVAEAVSEQNPGVDPDVIQEEIPV